MDKRNFVIVGTQRTGSSVIAESISQHPEVNCGWEWTLHSPWYRKIQVAEAALAGDFSGLRKQERDHIVRTMKPTARWLGYRSLFRSSDKWLFDPSWSPALWLDRLQAHRAWFARRKDIHVIHIVRSDNIAWLRSKYLSRATRAYTAQTYPEDMRVTISEREAVRRIEAKNWLDRQLQALSASNPYVQVAYESFLASPVVEIGRLLGHLGCEAGAVTLERTTLQPQSTIPAEIQIRNFPTLCRTLTERGLLLSGA